MLFRCNRCIKASYRDRQILMMLRSTTSWELQHHMGVHQEARRAEIPKVLWPDPLCAKLAGHLNTKVSFQTAQLLWRTYSPVLQKRPTKRKSSKTSRKRKRRRRRRRIRVLDWYTLITVSAQRRRWHKCPGTHSLPMERKRTCQRVPLWPLPPLPQVQKISSNILTLPVLAIFLGLECFDAMVMDRYHTAWLLPRVAK